MKRFVSPIPNGGLPIFVDDFLTIDLENLDAINAILSGYNEPIVVSGVEVSNLDTNAKTFDLSAGLVFLNGSIMRVPSYSGTYPLYISEGATVQENRDFEDGNNETVLETKSAQTTTSLPAGESILLDPYTESRFAYVQRRAGTPTGEIIMVNDTTNLFDGTGLGVNALKGFALCNGSNGTPDLTGRFVVGQKDSDSDLSLIHI